MNIKHAQYMLTVLKEGSITAAAKKLYISQPSLSQMIKLVENTLGTPIFNRTTDPITLTYAGEKYIEAAKKILTINANLIKEIDEINHEEHGTIKLGIPVQQGYARSCLMYCPVSCQISSCKAGCAGKRICHYRGSRPGRHCGSGLLDHLSQA